MLPVHGQKLFDALVIGGGPAGLSAALALGRVCRSALLFDSGEYRNRGVTAMHTVLSRDGTSPDEFHAISRRQIEDGYPSVSFRQKQVLQVAHTEVEPGYMGFQATDSENQTFSGRKLILASGTEDILPTDIEGYEENWPSHIYQCLFCDGFEQKDFPIGILSFSNPSYAHLALMALGFNSSVTIYSNGPVSDDATIQKGLKMAMASKVKLDERRVQKLINNGEGPERGITVEFENGPSVTLGMLLHRPATRNRAHHLIKQLGLKTKDGSDDVAVDPMFSQASVPGCIVAGDAMESVKQIAVAMGAGVRAGAVVTFQLCNEEGGRAVASLNEKL